MPPKPLERVVDHASVLCRCRRSETGVTAFAGHKWEAQVYSCRSVGSAFSLFQPSSRSVWNVLRPAETTTAVPRIFLLETLSTFIAIFQDCSGHDAIWKLVALTAHQVCETSHACHWVLRKLGSVKVHQTTSTSLQNDKVAL
jgi:hypothetical protein